MSWVDDVIKIAGTWGEVEQKKAEAKNAEDWKDMAERVVEQSTSYQESGRQMQENTLKIVGIAGLAVVGAVVAFKVWG